MKKLLENNLSAHLSALLTIFIWGTTFVSTKILLSSFSPIEILILRFSIGFVIFALIYPKFLKPQSFKTEATIAAAGLCGICLYYLLENIALTYTRASNVGIIVAAAPFFTAIFSKFIFKEKEKLQPNFFIGFVAAISGIMIISVQNQGIEVNPLGDLLALLAAIIWAIYSLLTKKISTYKLNTILTTRRIFLYGLIFMISFAAVFKFKFQPALIFNVNNIIHLLYLGIGASALCFVSWNFSVKKLGAVKTSIYIYMVPVITVIASAIVLHEKITFSLIAGASLTISGLAISEIKFKRRKSK